VVEAPQHSHQFNLGLAHSSAHLADSAGWAQWAHRALTLPHPCLPVRTSLFSSIYLVHAVRNRSSVKLPRDTYSPFVANPTDLKNGTKEMEFKYNIKVRMAWFKLEANLTLIPHWPNVDQTLTLAFYIARVGWIAIWIGCPDLYSICLITKPNCANWTQSIIFFIPH